MSNPKVFATPKQDGDQLTAAEANALDNGQAKAITHGDSTTLSGDTTIDLGGKILQVTGSAGTWALDSARTLFNGLGWPALGAKNITNHCPTAVPEFNAGEFEYGVGFIRQVANSVFCRWYFTLPVGCTLNGVSLPLKKSSGALPGTKAQIAVAYFDYTAGDPGNGTVIGSIVTDPSANAGAYQTYHFVNVTGLNHTVTAGRQYVVAVIGDSASTGGNYLNVYRPLVDITLNSTRIV